MDRLKKVVNDFSKLEVNYGAIYVYALGIVNQGLWLYFVAIVVSAIAYLCLTNCYSEMISIIPFSGGCYGYVRCSLGPLFGYIVGCIETAKYILYTTASIYLFGHIFLYVYQFDEDWLPVIWLAFYFLAIFIQAFGGQIIWWSWGLLALAILTVQLIFVFGAIKEGRLENLRYSSNEFDNSGRDFMNILPLAGYFFTGIDCVRTCANDQSNKTVPRAMVIVMYFTIALALSTVVAARSYVSNPADLGNDPYPYSFGIDIVLKHINHRKSTFFSLAGVIGSSLGFSYGGARQMRAMASSGLLPPFLVGSQHYNIYEVVTGRSAEPDGVKETKPVVALIVCSVLSYTLLVAGYYEIENFQIRMLRMAGIATCVEIWGMLSGYVIFSTRFSHLERGFRSPFGILGAIIGMLFFVLIFISYFGYGGEDRVAIGCSLILYIFLSLLYYIFVAKKRQFFSKEEQEKFMKAYVVNANRRKKRGATSQKGLRKPYSLFGDILVRVYTNIAVAMSVANSLGSSSNSSRGRELSIGSKICSNVADTSSASQTDHGGGSIDLYSIEQSKSFHLSHHSHLLSTIPHNKVIPDIGVGETNEEDERLNFSENNEKSMRVSTPSVLIRPV
eukprot:scaffold1170_cov158-Ochromonas_danica.AAC.8